MYSMHAISALVSHLVPSDLILTSPESCKISATSGPYFLAKNWCIVTSLNPMPSVFCLQANMYIDTHQWLNLHFSPPITSEKDDLRQFNSGFTKRLSINEDLRTRKATYQFPGECLNLRVLGIEYSSPPERKSVAIFGPSWKVIFMSRKSREDEIKFSLAWKSCLWKWKL